MIGEQDGLPMAAGAVLRASNDNQHTTAARGARSMENAHEPVVLAYKAHRLARAVHAGVRDSAPVVISTSCGHSLISIELQNGSPSRTCTSSSTPSAFQRSATPRAAGPSC